MATPADSEAVKSLNNSKGKKEFVFKNFSQRISDIDIQLYRSLDKMKAEPSFEEQENRVIKELLALEASNDDQDDAFMSVMGTRPQ
ncbi:PREDICTED: uncharacterized protein LOC109128763 [Camelina sativa]|uniref:Uncharacterized protein LOC109128763 n=1 Tax=Camelina sativa TaxID=90675 RepID=A0ABM1QWW0_CAMSA|nr:PREDICTED: uncharacterized protein LOC109128763 [Camelina sativa]